MDFAAIRARLGARRPRRVEDAKAASAAVALILAPGTPGDPAILFIRRAEHPDDPWSGQIGLPGGRRDGGDTDEAGTAVRETLEETGIGLEAGALLGQLDDLHPLSPALPPVVVRPFVYGLDRRPEIRPSREVAGHFWAPLSALRAGAGRARVDIRGETSEVRAYLVGTSVIWGMTHRIIEGFLSALEEAR